MNFTIFFNDTVIKEFENKYFDKYPDVLKWFCDLCEITPIFKSYFVSFFNYHTHYLKLFPIVEKNRIKTMFNELEFPEFICKNSSIWPRISQAEDDSHHLPRSNYLESIISDIKIVSNLSEIPKKNSQLIPEHIALGLPAFRSFSIEKDIKPVIIDCRYLIQTFIYKKHKNFEKNKIFGNRLYEHCGKKEVNSESAKLIQAYRCFCNWLSRLKPKKSPPWYWCLADVGINYKQTNPNEASFYYPDLDSEYWEKVLLIWPKESFRKALNEPSAVVLQDKEFSILLDEFCDHYSALIDQFAELNR